MIQFIKEIGKAISSVFKIFQQFLDMILGSNPMLIFTVISVGYGYGFSFVLFDYRKNDFKLSHLIFQPILGLIYSIVIFTFMNWNKIYGDGELTKIEFEDGVYLALITGALIWAIICIPTLIIREVYRPYQHQQNLTDKIFNGIRSIVARIFQ